MRARQIAVLVATLTDAVTVLASILIMKKPRRRPGGRKETLSLSALKPPGFDLASQRRNPCLCVPCMCAGQTSLFQPRKEAPLSRGTGRSWAIPSASTVKLSSPSPCAQPPGIGFPPWLESAGLCVASWKHSRPEAPLNRFPQSWDMLSFEQTKMSWLEALEWEPKKSKKRQEGQA